MSKVAQIPNPSLAPLGMYDLKPVFDLDAKVDIPDCMYRWQFKTTWTKPIDVLIQGYQWSRAASILRILVGSAQVRWNVFESTKNLGNILIQVQVTAQHPVPLLHLLQGRTTSLPGWNSWGTRWKIWEKKGKLQGRVQAFDVMLDALYSKRFLLFLEMLHPSILG